MIYQNQKLRHEIKYYINQAVFKELRTRLQVFLKPDPNMSDPNGYLISSVYFDDFIHQALQEKESGIEFRKKYRIIFIPGESCTGLCNKLSVLSFALEFQYSI